jgi:hypothetical protein
MPLTPAHFPPGLLFKALAPERFSLTAFVAANVAVDLEPICHILRGDPSLHGPLHALLGATAAGVIAGAAVSLLPLTIPVPPPATLPVRVSANLSPEFRASACVAAGIVAGLSHSLADAFLYADLRPFAPFSQLSPLLGVLAPDALLTALLVTGAVGLTLLARRRVLSFKARSRAG